LLEISAATIITMVVAFTTKYSEVGMIFENAEKVEAILDDEAKKEILINYVVGTTFQAVQKSLILKAFQIQNRLHCRNLSTLRFLRSGSGP